MVGRQLLEALQPGAYVVHTARGGIIDEDALQQAIRTRGLRAGLDVYINEFGFFDMVFSDAIAQNEHVYGTHHIGASTDQATESVGSEVVRIVECYQRTGSAPNCVNLTTQTRATHLLVVRHADRVGVLASVLDALRHDDVNVQEMENIVFRGEGSAAVARIQVNRAPSAQAFDVIQSHTHILSTSLVALER
jgi:D-3-phosphoglycerate dehydrogenase